MRAVKDKASEFFLQAPDTESSLHAEHAAAVSDLKDGVVAELALHDELRALEVARQEEMAAEEAASMAVVAVEHRRHEARR